MLVFTRNACLHLAYASSTGVRVRTWQYVFVSNRSACLSTTPTPLGYTHKYHAPTIPRSSPLKAWTVTVVWTDATMPCLSKAFQQGPHQKLFFHLNESNNYKKAKMKGGLSWMTNDYREWTRSLFNGNHFSSYSIRHILTIVFPDTGTRNICPYSTEDLQWLSYFFLVDMRVVLKGGYMHFFVIFCGFWFSVHNFTILQYFPSFKELSIDVLTLYVAYLLVMLQVQTVSWVKKLTESITHQYFTAHTS